MMRGLIPRWWRLPVFIFLIILLAVSSIVTLRQASATAPECLSRGAGWRLDISTRKSFSPRYTIWNNFQAQYGNNGLTYQRQPGAMWSAQAGRYAHLNYENSWITPTRLTIDSPSEGLHREFTFQSNIQSGDATGYIWSGQADSYLMPIQYLIWSPDGQYLLFAYYDAPNNAYQPLNGPQWTYSLFGVDGTFFDRFTSIPQRPDTLAQWRAVWSADSRAVILPQFGVKPLVLHLPDMRLQVASKDMPNGETRIAIPKRTDGKTTITLSNLNGDKPVTLVEGATDAGDPSWSPDGKYIAVVWAVRSGSEPDAKRQLYLTWAQADGTQRSTLTDNPVDITELTWLKDGKSLLYLSHERLDDEDAVRVKILDMTTGQVRQLGDTYANAVRVEENPTNGRISFWWEQRYYPYNGIATYEPDGSLVYNSALRKPIDGTELFRTPYRFVKWQEIFRSPDGSVYAVRHMVPPAPTVPMYSTLELIAADGSWSRLLAGFPSTISDPIWSPDSKLMAYAEYKPVQNFTGYNTGIVKLVTAHGDPVRQLPELSDTAGISWTQCG